MRNKSIILSYGVSELKLSDGYNVSSHLVSKDLRIQIYTTVTCVLLCHCETWSLALWVEHRHVLTVF